jgi:SAM-dependent methyltransferase
MTAYRVDEGLEIYESAMAAPYFQYLRRVLPRIFEEYGVAGGASLDLACGSGRLVGYLLEQGWDARGCDLSEQMIERAPEALGGRLVIADMCEELERAGSDLVTIVFNSIHYLDPERRRRLLEGLGRALRPGGFFISQHNPIEAMRRYWAGRTHRWSSDRGFAFWTGHAAGRDAVTVEKQYFERIPPPSGPAGEVFRQVTVSHRYHFFDADDLRAGLEAQGIDVVGAHDGRTLGAADRSSDSIWLVARRRG